MTLRGSLIDPTADAAFVLPALVIDGVGQGTARGDAVASRSLQGVTTADVTIGSSHITATNIQHAGNGTLSGSVALTTGNVSPLIAWLSPAIGAGITGAVTTHAELSGTSDTWQFDGHVEGAGVSAAVSTSIACRRTTRSEPTVWTFPLSMQLQAPAS